MARTIMRGGVLALAVAVAAALGEALGLDATWPVLIAAAVGFAAFPTDLGRVAAFVVGAGTGWVVLALRAEFLPFTTASRILTGIITVALLTAVAAATRERLPLWAGLVGAAAFGGIYEAAFNANPAGFLADSTAALVSCLIGAAIGFAAAMVSDLATATGPAPEPAYPVVDGATEEVA